MESRSSFVLIIGFGVLIVLIGVLGVRAVYRAESIYQEMQVAQDAYLRSEEFRRRFPNELGQGHTVLASIGFVDDRHALMLKDMFEQRVLVRRVVPLDRLIQHHDEKPIDRLREEQLAQAIRRKGHGSSAAGVSLVRRLGKSSARRGAL